MIPKSNLLALAALPAVQATFLTSCWPGSTQRLDPLVFPGQVASHMHDIVGGNGFAPVMDYNTTQSSTCTTCMVNKDFSNYWVASMYHQAGDTLTPVSQHGSASIYYMNNPSLLAPGEQMKALPTGLRMLAGFSDGRAESPTMESEAIRYKCLDYNDPSPKMDIKGFPQQACKDGVRAQVMFPSCWDGKNLDSEDHKSHMAYPANGPDYGGKCPDTHPVHTVAVKMEVIFETFKFPWGTDGKNPFIWSNGDNTGWGLHADMIMGWPEELLQAAVDQCHDDFGEIYNCQPLLPYLPPTRQYMDPKTCTLENWVNEDSTAIVNKLPGCNNIGSVVKAACQDGVTLKGNWAGVTGNFVNNAVNAVSSAVGGLLGGAPAAPSAAPAQFYGKPADAPAAPPAAPAPSPAAAPPAAAPPAGNPHVKTETVWVTTTTIVYGGAPAAGTPPAVPAPAADAPAAGGWTNAKREEHVHKHARAHGRRWAL